MKNMLKIAVLKREELETVSEFIAKMNRKEECHIGYCGTDSDEISDTLKNDFEVPFWESFVTVYHSNMLVGVLGFETDYRNKRIEVWGPFVENQYWTTVSEMWQAMLQLVPDEINMIQMFPNVKNKNCLALAEKLRFTKKSKQAILQYCRKRFDGATIIQEISPPYISSFIALHDKTFPKTYYSGKQIIERLNEHHKVFVTTEKYNLTGYIYVEVEPEFEEANIEFFAVDEAYRGIGFGSRLLQQALSWLFTFRKINTVTLCVNAANKEAIRVYERTGFDLIHELEAFSKKLQ
ncbi:GNAT family N-acetyltransferase [Guptibacillus algicola]|uniref:GNAT family N-acetyltransferase n=1 Tax=Guptibacillus algicola TaxID=225844 RepID=UPI001CD3D84C|nr:GNAT family N-acetyltransferase [Alkalihalobacillus algicola]MCA0986521.1 GNAT family N-acetyltransferase [Alkalihalobacillus algicola]